MQKLFKQFIALFALTFIFTQATGVGYAATETLNSVRLEPLVVNMVIAVLIPVLTGILTKVTWSSGTKGLITLVLTMTQTLIVQNTVDDGSAFFNQETILAFILSFTISIASYYGIYKPAKITSSTVIDVGTRRVEPGSLANVGVK